jgi:hypothetical protein
VAGQWSLRVNVFTNLAHFDGGMAMVANSITDAVVRGPRILTSLPGVRFNTTAVGIKREQFETTLHRALYFWATN